MTSLLNFLCNEILSSIEIQEAQLLNWGFVSGRLDLRKELVNIIDRSPDKLLDLWQDAINGGVSTDDVIENLTNRKLIFKLEDGTYRTRFSETIRLLYLLRQRFSNDDWFTARKLVSDTKLQLQRRNYPRRDITVEQLEDALAQSGISKIQIEVIKILLETTQGGNIKLAKFQNDSILQQLVNLRDNKDHGVVIGAGTGAGKTKAFYIPTLAHIIENIDIHHPYLQALALYPRNELLKDQLAEAFTEVRKLDKYLTGEGKRSITLAAYYGETPESADALNKFNKRYGWVRSSDELGYICPFFNCPNDANHELIWEIKDIDSEIKNNKKGQYGKYERLRCPSCGFETHSSHLILTRALMRQTPPDILFTSTEMLNRRMSRATEQKLFGIGQERPPRLVLLDEIHTYEGIHGAQVAYLIRRWRHARSSRSNKNLCIVGLSATLTQAVDFFSKLTGIPDHNIDYLSPTEDELIEEGMEYNVVIKGDPVSGTSLLSTSVQTVMLLGRILDPIRISLSNGAYGQRIFAFTDKLDVINRWFHIMYDAEFVKTLSQYRVPYETSTLSKRRDQGQVWDICHLLTYDLNDPLSLGRTTSQDPGVNQNAKLIIATSTLEVGFNDPTVGAIIQHKAPRSMASFTQRKGRAGRTRDMRPWTVVVTSAYGRDRWAFQHAESLFSPYLPPIDLPIENYYVRKIQAAYTLMDWLVRELKDKYKDIDIWLSLSSGSNFQQSSRLSYPRRLIREKLLEILQGKLRLDFEEYLRNALGLSEDSNDLFTVLWGEPRSLYFEVIPTLIRQLDTNWRRISANKEELWADHTSQQPMPDFVPAALFTDLNLPEVQLKLPTRNLSSTKEDDEFELTMPIAQTIQEFAPGRANKRFVLQFQQDIAHWIPLPDEAQLSRGILNLSLLPIDFDPTPFSVNIRGETYEVYRPRIYKLEEIPENIRSTSTAELIWRSNFLPRNHRNSSIGAKGSPRNSISLSSKSQWKQFFSNIDCYTQSNGQWVDVSRLAIGVRVETRYKNGSSRVQTLFFEDLKDENSAAIGFKIAADALHFSIEPLDVDSLRSSSEWTKLYCHFGPEYFRYRLHNDRRLIELGLSSFAIDWLWQLEYSMLVSIAIARQIPLMDAAKEININRREIADNVLRAIFQSQRTESDDEENVGRLHTELLEYNEDPTILSALLDTETVLWDDNNSDLTEWLEESYTSSIGATLFASITHLVPDIDTDELILDVDGYEIWITESTAGGVGLISKIADAIAQHPHNLELQLIDSVYYCGREDLSTRLASVVELLALKNEKLLGAFEKVRRQTDLPSLIDTKKRLTEALETNGIPVTRQLIVSLNSKFLRPNSDEDSDALITSLIDVWRYEEARLGIAIDLRVIAVAARQIPEIDEKINNLLTRVGGNQDIDVSQKFNLLQSILWLECHDSCPDCIEKWHPYQNIARPSRALLKLLLNQESYEVHFNSPYWESTVREKLASNYHVQISCQIPEKDQCIGEISHFLTIPIDIGFQRFFPVVDKIRLLNKRWYIHFAISELVGS